MLSGNGDKNGVERVNGGKSKNTTVNNGGTQSVLSGGTADGATVNSGGRQIAESGGVWRHADRHANHL